MLSITVGLVASQLLRLIPYVGAPIVTVMWMIGGGGAIAAFFVWRRSRKQRRRRPIPRGRDDGEDASRRLRRSTRMHDGRGGNAPAVVPRLRRRRRQKVETVTWLAPPVKRIS